MAAWPCELALARVAARLSLRRIHRCLRDKSPLPIASSLAGVCFRTCRPADTVRVIQEKSTGETVRQKPSRLAR